jgi:hypothetical protein
MMTGFTCGSATTRTFLIRDHLQQDQSGDVLVGLVLDDTDLLACHDQVADVLERDVPALRGVVEAPIRIFFDHSFAHTLCCPQADPLLTLERRGFLGECAPGHRALLTGLL